MGLKIIISGAVKSSEKDSVKQKLKEMRAEHIINFDDDELYDCNDHGIYWDKESNQDIIDGIIKKVDWFICLIPEYTVGLETWNELKERLEAKRDGAPVVISVFHPKIPDDKKQVSVPKESLTYDEVMSEADVILGNKKRQYEVRYNYGDYDDLKWHIEDQYVKLYNKDRVFWSQHINYFAKTGKYVKATEMFFDEERASMKWGFCEGENVYIWRQSVDGKINQAIDNYGIKFLFITGKPSSGKSRAMYELLHSTLRDKQVIIVKDKNVAAICKNLQTELKQLDNGGDFKNTDYYFVCDQINDVFQKAGISKDLKLSFLRNISESDNCWLIATGTRQSLSNFIEDSEGEISSPDKKRSGGNSDLISIPLISDDIESYEILEKLRHRYNVDKGETIGDFITELNDYKTRIVDEIINSVEKYDYLRDLLKSIQLTLNYRHITPLLLPINLLRQYAPNDNSDTFARKTIDCLNFLIDKNVIRITNTHEDEEFKKFPRNSLSRLSEPLETDIDDERYPKYVPNFYIFTVNELVWEHLEKRSLENKEDTILYNLFDYDELLEASGFLFKSYPHAATLRRVVSRAPLRKGFRDREGDEQRKRITWEFSIRKIKELDVANEADIEMVKAFNILIGRSKTITEIDELLSLMEEKNVEIDDSTIGEMYSFAIKNLKHGTDDFTTFIDKTQELNNAQQKRDSERNCAWTYKDCYRISREIALLSQTNDNYTYNDAFNIVSNFFFRLIYTTPDGVAFQPGRPSVKAIGNQKNTIERRSLDALMLRLAKLCRTPKEIKQLIQCHQYYEIEPNSVMLHQIGKILKDGNKLQDIIKVLFPDKESKVRNAVLYERTIVSFVSHLRTFKESVELYKMWHEDLNMNGRHNPKLVSLCLKNCGAEELQSAIAFIDKLPENAVNGISYNILISVASNTEDAMYLVKKMRPEDIDEYTLSSCLKCVETIQQKNYSRNGKNKQEYESNEVKKVSPLQIFLFAYEFINHSLLESKRTREACLQKLYRLTSDRYQEEYINRIVGRKEQALLRTNDYINATRIMRDFYTFSDAWEKIYFPAKQRFDDTTGTIMPDLFNNMCAKYYKDLKGGKIIDQPKAAQYRNELQEDIERVIRKKRIVQDEYFFLNYHIKFLGGILFDHSGDNMAPFFMDWFDGRVGNYNPENISILSRYLDYIYDMTEPAPELKWRMANTIYEQYKQYFIKWRLSFKPSDAVYACLLKIAKDCKDNSKKYQFVDIELNELDIDRSIKLNYYINNFSKYYTFEYNRSHPRKDNRQISNLVRIEIAETTAEVLEVLLQEVNIEGFIAPSILNCAIEKYRIFQSEHAKELNMFLPFIESYMPKETKKINLFYLVKVYAKKQRKSGEASKLLGIIKNYHASSKTLLNLKKELSQLCDKLDEEQYQEIVKFIKNNNLEKVLTLRGIAILASLTKDNDKRLEILRRSEQYHDIDENCFGRLATNLAIARTSITYSRMYFRKWIAIYRDVYANDKALTESLSQAGNEDKWNTIGLHLKNEVFALSRIHKESHLPMEEKREKFYEYLRTNKKTDILDVIAEILTLFYLQPKYFKLRNFNRSVSFEDVIALLKFHTAGNWQEIYDVLSLQKSI